MSDSNPTNYPAGEKPYKSRPKINFAAGIAGLLLLAAAVTTLVRLVISSPQDQRLPHPNGYVDFLAAGQMIRTSGVDPPNWDDSVEKFRHYVSINREALNLGRTGLARQCQVVSEAEDAHHMQESMAIKFLGQAFGVEGDLATRENRLDDAAKCYLDVMRLAALATHGGDVFDNFLSFAVEGTATIDLNAIIHRLNLDQCCALLAELDKIEHEKETPGGVLEHENRRIRRKLLTADGFKYYLDVAGADKSLDIFKRSRQSFYKLFDKTLQEQTDLKAKLAARAYLLATGHSANSWHDLTPVYVEDVPKVTFAPSDVDK